MSPITNVSDSDSTTHDRHHRNGWLLAWAAATLAAALFLAVVFVLGYAEYTAYKQRQQVLGQIIQLLNYNVAKGHLEVVPVQEPPPPASAPAADPAKK